MEEHSRLYADLQGKLEQKYRKQFIVTVLSSLFVVGIILAIEFTLLTM